MSWRERPYNQDDQDSGYYPRPLGEMKSWVGGGFPKPGPALTFLLVSNSVLFFLCLFTGRGESPIIEWGSMTVDSAIYRFQFWRLLTYSYLHSPYTIRHILFNMLVLYMFGGLLERRWGTGKFFIFYTVGSIAACALFVPLTMAGILPPHDYLIGASGGVLATIGACAALMPDLKMFFCIPIRPFCAILVILYTWDAFVDGSGGDACHLAGLAFGVYFGYRGNRWFNIVDNWGTKRAQAKWEAERQSAVRLEQDVDRILEKVRRDGIQSLTRREKQTLETATKSRQQSGHARHH